MGENSSEKLAESPHPRRVSPKIKDMPKEEWPREKLMARGADSLTDAELLALLFGSGVAGMNVVDMSRSLIAKYGSLTALSRVELKELMSHKGIGPAKAVHLAAALALGKRLAHQRFNDQPLDTPQALADLLGPEMRILAKESLRVVLLNTKLTLISVQEVHIGSVNEVTANIQEILRPVIAHGAYGFTLAHNHPSGDPTPSAADHNMTRKLNEACKIMQMRLFDHIIIGQPTTAHPEGYYSFREHGLL